MRDGGPETRVDARPTRRAKRPAKAPKRHRPRSKPGVSNAAAQAARRRRNRHEEEREELPRVGGAQGGGSGLRVLVICLVVALLATALLAVRFATLLEVETDAGYARPKPPHSAAAAEVTEKVATPASLRTNHGEYSEEAADDEEDGEEEDGVDGRAGPTARHRLRGGGGSNGGAIRESFFRHFPAHYPRETTTYDCTLVTQTSLSRLAYVKGLVAKWSASVVVAIAVPNGAPSPGERAALANLNLPPRVDAFWSDDGGADPSAYPVNSLRNEAIARVTSTHFLLVDVDFWPSATLLTEFYALKPSILGCKKCAFIAPSFSVKVDSDGRVLAEVLRRLQCEGDSCLDGSLVPRTNAQLKRAIKRGGKSSTMGAVVARVKSSNGSALHVAMTAEGIGVQKFCRPCHASSSVDWRRWPRAHAAYRIKCLRSPRFEPYFIVPTLRTTPRFANEFVGYVQVQTCHFLAGVLLYPTLGYP